MTCATCGGAAEVGSVFCARCGSGVAAATAPPALTRQVPAPQPVPAGPTGPPAHGLPVYRRRSRGGRVVAVALLLGLMLTGGVVWSIVNAQRSVDDVFVASQERFAATGVVGEELSGPTDLRVTVSDWTTQVPAPPGPALPGITAPRPGYRFAAVQALVCVGPYGFAGATDFSVRMADGTDERPLVAQRVLAGGLGSVSQGQCQRGPVVFELPEAGTPTAVVMNGRDSAGFANPLAPVRLEWTLPG